MVKKIRTYVYSFWHDPWTWKKIHRFHVPQPTFLFPVGTPVGQSRYMLCGWKVNSMLTNCLAACTHLTITVSEIERDICEKNRHFIIPLAFDDPDVSMLFHFTAMATFSSIYYLHPVTLTFGPRNKSVRCIFLWYQTTILSTIYFKNNYKR